MENIMEGSALQLATLPVELLYCIFRQLDPAGLVAASQTCNRFRSIIQPGRKHFAERLLALEIEPEHGGPSFKYFARENRLEPDWNETVWNQMRWACTHCLKLLPHAAFDNRSLLRLKNRKPAPGSQAAKLFSGTTSWEPVEKRALTAKAERRQRALIWEEKQIEKLLRKQYHIATTKSLGLARYNDQSRTSSLRAAELPEISMFSDQELDTLTEEQEHALLDSAAERIEGLRMGSDRHFRKCNECRYQLGGFKQGPLALHNQHGLYWSFNNNKGTPEVPIVRSRRLKFTTPFDRYFPGVAPYMSAERPDFVLPLWRIYREDTTYMPSTLYMARCPSCATWQELRAFRWSPRGWGYGEFIGVGRWMTELEVAAHREQVNNMVCNRCEHDMQGHSAITQQLSTFMIARLKTECCTVLEILSGHWKILSYPPIKPKHKHQSRLKQLLKSLEAAEKNFTVLKHGEYNNQLDVDADDVEDNLAVMKRRRMEWLHIRQEEKMMADACVERSKQFGVWQDEWDEAIEYWRWTRAWIAEAEKEPQKLVRWALERNAMKLN